MIRFVIAGTHQQYLDWIAQMGATPAEFRPFDDNWGRGVRALDVLSFDQVGTYWDNPNWGSGAYRAMMEEGVRFDVHWAMPWDADFLKAQTLKTRERLEPVRADEVAAALARQRDLERRLGSL